jgi:hypothetical protein
VRDVKEIVEKYSMLVLLLLSHNVTLHYIFPLLVVGLEVETCPLLKVDSYVTEEESIMSQVLFQKSSVCESKKKETCVICNCL